MVYLFKKYNIKVFFIFHFYELTLILFLLGLFGLLSSRNILLLLMSIEIFFLGASGNVIISSITLDELTSQFFALLVLVVAASETALGLSFLVSLFRSTNTINIFTEFHLKG